jgi:mono/diheme cytochrome c family protein
MTIKRPHSRFGPRLQWLVALSTILLAIGCRSVRRGEPIVGPLSTNDPAVQHGKIVFARRCDSCHPGGEGGLGPGINDKPLPVFAMKLQVRTGVVGFGVMPSFNKHQIPSEDLDDLMKYIKAVRKQNKPLEQARQ